LPTLSLMKHIDLTSQLKSKVSGLKDEFGKLAKGGVESYKKISDEWKKNNELIMKEVAEKSRKAWSRPIKPWGEVISEAKKGIGGFIGGITGEIESFISPSPSITSTAVVGASKPSATINYNPVYQISGVTADEIKNLIDESNKDVLNQLERYKMGGV